MPNICYNTTTMHGRVEDIENLLQDIVDIEDDNVLYNLTLAFPIPEAIEKISSGAVTIDGERHSEWTYDDDGNYVALSDEYKKELINKYGVLNAIDWQYANWGTKWGDMDTTLSVDNTHGKTRTIVFNFESAWGQPWALLNDIANKYRLSIKNEWQVEFEYDIETTEYPMDITIANKEKALGLRMLQSIKDIVGGIKNGK